MSTDLVYNDTLRDLHSEIYFKYRPKVKTLWNRAYFLMSFQTLCR